MTVLDKIYIRILSLSDKIYICTGFLAFTSGVHRGKGYALHATKEVRNKQKEREEGKKRG